MYWFKGWMYWFNIKKKRGFLENCNSRLAVRSWFRPTECSRNDLKAQRETREEVDILIANSMLTSKSLLSIYVDLSIIDHEFDWYET